MDAGLDLLYVESSIPGRGRAIMRKTTVFVLLIGGVLGMLCGACGPGAREDETDGGSPCGMETYCGTDPQGVPICADLQKDPMNCGSCNTDCRAPEANACIDGLCACADPNQANVSDTCADPSVCATQTGQCIVPDLMGDACDPVDSVPCPDGQRLCLDRHCTLPDCDHPEICDGRDNDCDGHTDALGPHPGQAIPLQRECYTGDPSWNGVGLCHQGEQICQSGAWNPCAGEVLPVIEEGALACDELDNDCNGCIDDRIDADGAQECGPIEAKKFDVIFIIDLSGSMGSVLPAVVVAAQSWAMHIGTNPNVRLALVNPTDVDDGENHGVRVTLPLSNMAAFNAVMANVTISNSSFEPMHYATQMVLDGSFDAQLHADPAARRIVIAVHDERTGMENAVAGYDEASVCAWVAPHTSALLAIIAPPFRYEEWDACTSSEDMPPTAIPLSGDAGTMLAHLRQILDEVPLCQ